MSSAMSRVAMIRKFRSSMTIIGSTRKTRTIRYAGPRRTGAKMPTPMEIHPGFDRAKRVDEALLPPKIRSRGKKISRSSTIISGRAISGSIGRRCSPLRPGVRPRDETLSPALFHHIDGLPDFSALRFTKYNQYDSMILPLMKYLQAHGVDPSNSASTSRT
jgi:hypothetical protein